MNQSKISKIDYVIALSVLLIWIPLLLLRDYINISIEQSVFIIAFGELVLLIPVFYFLFTKKLTMQSFRFTGFSFKGCLVAIGFFILAFIVNVIYASILQKFNLHPQIDLVPYFKMLSTPYLILLIFGGSIIAPIVEEIYFRGLLFNLLNNRLKTYPAAIVSSLIFSIVHIYPNSFLPIFMLGMAFTLTYIKTKSLYPSIILHSVNNLFALLATLIISQLPG